MLLHLHRPRPPLSQFVELITYYSGYQPDHTMEKLLPDGAVEIIVDLTEQPKRLFERDDYSRTRSFRGAWISGMRKGWIVIEAAPDSSMAVIRFRPGGAYPFLGFDVDGITDVVDPLDSVFHRAANSLRDRVLEAPDVPTKLLRIEEWLLELGGRRLEQNPVIDYLCNRLFAPAGIRISDVVREIGYSERHVLGLFRRWVGLTPKQYGRVRRFQQMLHSISPVAQPGDTNMAGLRGSPPPEPDWVDVALRHGYYDQSHLNRDFREFSGMTPREYTSSFRGLQNYLPLDGSLD